MKSRILVTLTIAAFLLLVAGVPLISQSYNPAGGSRLSRVAGRFVASVYNYPSTNNYVVTGNSSTGSASIVVQTASINLPDGRTIYPYNVTAPILVGSGSNQEQVTPTAVSNCFNLATGAGTCTITASFSNTHSNGDPVQSATAGLAEAIYDAFNAGGGLVAIDNQWANGINTGCTGCAASPNAALYALVPFPTVAVEDDRLGAVQYWNVTPATTTVLATPAALTAQAACDSTHTTCSDATVAGSASWGGTVYCGITYVDIMGNESITSTTASWTSVASKAIDIGAPAASTGAVGWKPYCSVSGGTYALAYSLPLLTQPSTLLAVPVSSGVCTLTNLETVTPACALVNATYGQASSAVGAAGLFSKGGAQFTGYPVVTSQLAPNLDSASSQSLNPSNGGITIYKYVPSSRLGLTGLQSNWMSFPTTTAAQTTIGQVAGTIPIPPNFMNYVGRTIEVCGMLSKTSTTADTITNIQLWWDAEGSNVTAGTAVQLSNIQITQTLTAAANVSFCQDVTTTVASASATGGTLLPGFGWLTESQTSAGTIHAASTNNLFAAVGSLNLALNAKLEVVYNHTTGTDGAGVVLLNPTVKILN
jgi:hypothetical protein